MENAWLSIRKLWKLKWQMARKLNCVDKYHISCDVFLRFFCCHNLLWGAAQGSWLRFGWVCVCVCLCVCNDFACLLWTFRMMRIKFVGKCLPSRSKHFVSFRGCKCVCVCSGNVVSLLRLSHVSRFLSFPLEQDKHTHGQRERDSNREKYQEERQNEVQALEKGQWQCT